MEPFAIIFDPAGAKNHLQCIKVMHYDADMPDEQSEKRSTEAGSTRITVTFPEDHYLQVVRIAEQKDVSASWVVRDAVKKYLTADVPLFAGEWSEPK